MQFEPRPLVVACQSCGKTAETWDFQHPDLAVECSCCPVAHDHTGLGLPPGHDHGDRAPDHVRHRRADGDGGRARQPSPEPVRS